MKTISILILLLFLATANRESFGQFNDKALEPKYVYCEIIGTDRLLKANKVSIIIDYGDEKSLWKDNRVKDEETGKVKSFNSMIDALNMMVNDGWEFVQAYVLAVDGVYEYHYLLKRPVE